MLGMADSFVDRSAADFRAASTLFAVYVRVP